MGTWGEGLYDNDGALDLVGQLVRFRGEETDAARLVAKIGLLAWLDPFGLTHDSGGIAANVARLSAAIGELPEETRAALDRALTDREFVEGGGPRTPELHDVLGGDCDGPRLDPLLRFPGARPVIDELAANAAQILDRTLQGAGADLYEIADDLAALGLLIELTRADLHTPDPDRVARWRAGFDRIDRATRHERGFWWKYVRCVRLGFDLLAPAPAEPTVRERTPAE